MPKEPRFSNLSVGRQRLLRLCQLTNHGDINNLAVRHREPVLSDPQCVVLVDIKLDSEQLPRPEADQVDFTLSREAARLMAVLDKIHNGKISRLEIRQGIPRRVVWESCATDFAGDSK